MIKVSSKWLVGLIGLSLGISYLCTAVEARPNTQDELWEERTLNITGAVADVPAKPATHGPGRPIMIDVLDLKGMDILDVLKLVSQKSGLNIVAGQNVKGKVTVFLKDVEVREALRIILQSYDWAYVQDGDIMRVTTAREFEERFGYPFGNTMETRFHQVSHAKAEGVASLLTKVKSPAGKIVVDPVSGMLMLTDEASKLADMEAAMARIDVPLTNEIFILRYSNAGDLTAKILEMLTPALGTIQSDERTNRLMVTDTPAKVASIRAMVEAFDQRDREVLIEAKIVQVSLDDEHKLGVDWEAVAAGFHDLNFKSNFDVLGANDKRGRLSIGTLASDDYTVLVEALETVGKTNILSSPRIMSVNNQEAKILVGSTEPYVTTTTTTPSAGPTTTAESVNFIDVGVKLFVTPTIHEDDFITMKIKPEVSSVTSNLTTGNNNTIPVVETSEAETTVLVKDRVSVIIGGLIKDENIKTKKKVPLLGNIPVLGYAFRSTNDLASKTEIVIFLTPRIITGDGEGSVPAK